MEPDRPGLGDIFGFQSQDNPTNGTSKRRDQEVVYEVGVAGRL